MNQQEIAKFREEFKRIVCLRRDLTEVEARIKIMTRWDKNGSHKNALDNAIERQCSIRNEFKTLKKGHNYDDWQLFNKQITSIVGRIKNAKKKDTIEKLELELSRLTFSPARNKSA